MANWVLLCIGEANVCFQGNKLGTGLQELD
jgi:hypothetical protein